MKLVIEADGGSRGNPGIAGSGTVIYEADGTTVVRKLAYVVGTATNNVAEYHALYNGLCVAQQLGATDISVRMDSKLVVEQMSGRWKIKHPDMRELALKCQKILRTLHSAEFTWVPRRQNAAADALANLAMDAGATGHPIGFLTLDNDATEDVTETADIADITPTMATPMADAAGSKATAAETPAPTTWNGATTNATRMLLLRHGQTTMSRRRQYSGLSNPPLTELGEWQASRAAHRIAPSPRPMRPTQNCTPGGFSTPPSPHPAGNPSPRPMSESPPPEKDSRNATRAAPFSWSATSPPSNPFSGRPSTPPPTSTTGSTSTWRRYLSPNSMPTAPPVCDSSTTPPT